eukprot:TRINITY_DN229_c0_g2_i1.p1 TRINITY_DN229_c0_g2~~TRINITY_DN229_c0_g2_i1.p1  ORF type:complete len:563 (+),score=74.60 TRINITY_DN229_c0_g2_i1:59-1747(+)
MAQYSRSGQLWVRVIQANIFGLKKDPYLQLGIAQNENITIPLKTIVTTVSTDRVIYWNEEFAMYVPDISTHKLMIQLMEPHTLTKDLQIGKAILDISPDMFGGQIIESVLKISEVARNESKIASINGSIRSINPLARKACDQPFGGEIKILFNFTPSPAITQTLKIPSFRLFLERYTYFPGEVVRGTLLLNVGTPRQVRGVRLHFLGEEYVQWQESHTTTHTGANGQMQTTTHTVTHSDRFQFFNVEQTLFGFNKKDGGKLDIPSNCYVWPFEFTLPQNLPPSVEDGCNYIRYNIRGYMDIPWGRDIKVEMRLKICVEYARLNWAPEAYHTSKKMPLSFDNNQRVNMLTELPSTVSYIGSPFRFSVNVQNGLQSKELKYLNIELVQKAKLTACGRHRHLSKTVFKLKTTSGFPVAPGDQRQIIVEFQIPPDIHPTLPRTLSPIFTIDYDLYVEIDIQGLFSGKAKEKIQLILGHQLPFNPPPMNFMDGMGNHGSTLQLIEAFNCLIPPPPPLFGQNMGPGAMEDCSFVVPVIPHYEGHVVSHDGCGQTLPFTGPIYPSVTED